MCLQQGTRSSLEKLSVQKGRRTSATWGVQYSKCTPSTCINTSTPSCTIIILSARGSTRKTSRGKTCFPVNRNEYLLSKLMKSQLIKIRAGEAGELGKRITIRVCVQKPFVHKPCFVLH